MNSDVPMSKSSSDPMIRRGTCSACGGPADELTSHSDWWHNLATDCDGRRTRNFVPPIDGGVCAAPYRRSLTASLVLQFCQRPENHDGAHNGDV